MEEKVQINRTEIFSALVKRNELIDDHSRRVALLSVLIGQSLNLAHKDLRDLQIGAFLHDIGKLGLSQEILEKPGQLNDKEFEHIKTHPILGGNFVDAVGYPREIVYMVKYHHERLDGSGYPFGLGGEQIPLASRIIAVADVYEAMTANRSYRKALTVNEAFEELSQPSKYDQSVVQVLRKALSTVDLAGFHDLAVQVDTITDTKDREKVL